jgi:hypothetical protein
MCALTGDNSGSIALSVMGGGREVVMGEVTAMEMAMAVDITVKPQIFIA